jgi:glycosyltransferase involved in cell wall biosynthesis
VKLKNLQTIIPAFKQINDPKMRFVIVGSGEYELDLKKIAHEDNRIIFVGRKEGDELYAWYNVGQCFILSSYLEPFGAVTNEALLAGCRVIISNLAGSQCLVKDGENGYLVNPHDMNDIMNKIKATMESIAPISNLSLKPNLMLESFENKMNDVLKMFENL